jgi:membrane-bound metal-dependent hydrolase YbcI (DUF457 family)
MSLAIAAFFTLITGWIADDDGLGWVQGASIYAAILLIVTISSLNDWMKDRNFVKL